MSTENNTGVQTRAMAQRVDNKANPEQLQRAADLAMNPTVELHRTKEEAINEFIQQHSTITLDWHVPDLCNTRVGDLIKKRLQLETMEGRILFSSPVAVGKTLPSRKPSPLQEHKFFCCRFLSQRGCREKWLLPGCTLG